MANTGYAIAYCSVIGYLNYVTMTGGVPCFSQQTSYYVYDSRTERGL